MGHVVARPAIAGEVWLDIQELALRLRRAGVRVDGSQLVELGAKIILAVAKTGRLPEELEVLLDERARAKLHQLLAALATEAQAVEAEA